MAEVLTLIDELFRLERTAKNLTPEQRLAMRQEKSKPVVEAIFTWADVQKPLPRSGLESALGYLQGLKVGLMHFLNNPIIPLSNNECERAQRGLVLGRKNHYGSRSRRGTQVAAIFYTLVESAKLAGVKVRDYLLTLTEKALQQPGFILLPADYKKMVEVIAQT